MNPAVSLHVYIYFLTSVSFRALVRAPGSLAVPQHFVKPTAQGVSEGFIYHKDSPIHQSHNNSILKLTVTANNFRKSHHSGLILLSETVSDNQLLIHTEDALGGEVINYIHSVTEEGTPSHWDDKRQKKKKSDMLVCLWSVSRCHGCCIDCLLLCHSAFVFKQLSFGALIFSRLWRFGHYWDDLVSSYHGTQRERTVNSLFLDITG